MIVQLAASRQHTCQYCVPATSAFAMQMGVDEAAIQAARQGETKPPTLLPLQRPTPRKCQDRLMGKALQREL